jgi:hypothetical protein
LAGRLNRQFAHTLVRPVPPVIKVIPIPLIEVPAVAAMEVFAVVVVKVLTVIPLAVRSLVAVSAGRFQEYPALLDDHGPLNYHPFLYDDRPFNNDWAFNNHRPFDHHHPLLSNDKWPYDYDLLVEPGFWNHRSIVVIRGRPIVVGRPMSAAKAGTGANSTAATAA